MALRDVVRTVGRLGVGAISAAAAVAVTGSGGDVSTAAAIAAGIANVGAGYFTNRVNALEDAGAEDLRASKNHHLQLAIAGAMRTALSDLREGNATHEDLFARWDALLEQALDKPATYLGVVIPTEYDEILDFANPHLSSPDDFTAIEELLGYWAAYPKILADPVKLPDDLRTVFARELLPAFETNFANLLVRNDSSYARRAFTRRTLHELIANSRRQSEILERVDKTLLLPLVRLRPPEHYDASRELEILRAENRAIPVVGRDHDLRKLHEWLALPQKIACRVHTGPGGAGKTRLGIQLLEEIRGSGWQGGFVRPAALSRIKTPQWDKPTVAIIDYAATGASALRDWLEQLADLHGDDAPVFPLRVLLLERDASSESGWWRSLVDGSGTGDRIQGLFHPPAPERVETIRDVALRREIFQATLRATGGQDGNNVLLEQLLAGDKWQDPLMLMMAALVARHGGGASAAAALSRMDMAFRLAERELARITNFLRVRGEADYAPLLHRLAGIVTAGREVTQAQLLPIVAEEASSLGQVFPAGNGVAAARVTEILGRGGKPAPVEPDIVGEALLLKVFGRMQGMQGDEAGTQALVRLARRVQHKFAPNVCASITRTCQDFASEKNQTPLDWVEAFIGVGSLEDLRLLMELEAAMPHDTLVLRERAARLDVLLLERFRGLRKTAPSESVESEIARFANNLSVRLGDLGKREEALKAVAEAVEIGRGLARERPDAFLPALGSSLNNLGTMYSELGRREEGLNAASEAVEIRRGLAREKPAAFLPNLGMSLNNLSVRLGDLGKREEALKAAAEAVEIYRGLARERPDAFLPALGGSLNTLGSRYSELGKREEALQAMAEAVEIYRGLARERPDAFLPNMGMSLNNLGIRYSELGKREEALKAAAGAVDIYRGLARERPDAFLPDLGSSLNNLGTMYSELGKREEALKAAAEAVEIYRWLARERPDAFLPDLGMSLNNLGNRYSELGKREEALKAAAEAVEIRRGLARERPDAFLPALGSSLNNLGTMYSELGKREEALKAAAEAVEIYRWLARERPDAFLPALGASLNNLGTMYSELEKREEALKAAAEAVEIYRSLAREWPEAFPQNFATSLLALGRLVGQEDQRTAAGHFEEGMRVLLPQFERLPAAFAGLMAGLAQDYLLACEAAGVEMDDEVLGRVVAGVERLKRGG